MANFKPVNEVLREVADRRMETGFCGIAAAFNLCDNQEWEFDAQVKQKATVLLKDLIGLFNVGELKPNRRVIAANAAEADQDFRKFLTGLTRKKQRNRRVKA